MRILLVAVIGFACVLAVIATCGALLPLTHEVSRVASYHQPVEEIWAAITAPQTWRPGYQGEQRLLDLNGKRVWREGDITYETLEEDPPRRLVVRLTQKNHAFSGTWTYEIQPVSAGASLRITERGEVYNPIFRFLSLYILGDTRSIDATLRGLGTHYIENVDIED